MKTLLFLFFLGFSSVTFASGNCEIKITYLSKSGASTEKIFNPKASGKKDCEKKAVPYRANLAGSRVSQKTVSVQWHESRK